MPTLPPPPTREMMNLRRVARRFELAEKLFIRAAAAEGLTSSGTRAARAFEAADAFLAECERQRDNG